MNNETPEAAPLPPQRPRTTLMLTLWPETAASPHPVWRGVLETSNGRRYYFHTANGLLNLLTQLSGWPGSNPET